MEKRVRVKNHQQSNGTVNRFVTPALRQQIVRLKRELDGCESRLSDHLYVMNEVQEALTIAQECAQCLLTRDPFAAWERAMKRKGEEFNNFMELEDAPGPSVGISKEAKRIYEAKGNVTKLVTPEMRQRIVDLKGQLYEYAACLGEAFDHMLELESLNLAVRLADAMKCVNQLESWERRKEHERRVKEEEESLGDI